MLTDHIKKLLHDNLGYEATKDQGKLIDKAAGFIVNVDINEILLIKGYAGTGKTTFISSLVKTLSSLEYRSVLLAPTGRAAKVMSQYSGDKAFTIHKKIYRQKSGRDGMGDFVLDRNLHKNTFFIVDEASMISNQPFDLSVFGSGYLLNDLLSYVFNDKRCKLILVGDTAQLPPVGLSLSPALNKNNLERFGYPVIDMELKNVIRQAFDSGVLSNATAIRNMIDQDKQGFPSIDIEKYEDVELIYGNELIEAITDVYDKQGPENVIIINRSNKRANKYNQGVRNQVLWREEEILQGDQLMIVKNNYYWAMQEDEIDFIANGDIAEIVNIQRYQSLYDYRFADVSLRFKDYNDLEIDAKIMLDTLSIDTASLPNKENREFFYKVREDYSDQTTKKKQFQAVREDKFFNALQVKFAYAVTCHKAQGGQWHTVFIDHGFLTDEMINTDYLRWLYTAFTRATNKVYLVNFDKRHFEH